MSNYTKTTDFEAKDSLPTGDSGKIIRGAEFETEFDAISTAIATKADTAGPTFTGTLTFETISDGTIGVTAFVDEDDMSSDSATLVPTQQSVKAYVDSQVTAQDLDFQADSGGALSIDLDSETMTFTGGTGIDTSGSGNAVTFAIDSTVATLTGTQTLTNKTLTSPDVNTPDIDGGTIDGTVIGGTTPAAVSATTVSATGNITVGGTVDGRDVAADGTKLDGIEAGATADQTAAEIRTLVESATDSNVFTDADHTKLDGIEAGATGDQTNAEIRAAVEAATDSNVFTDADHTKLNGIEASADVTDTANVTAAGALMDSEVTNLDQVKAFDSADYATAAQGSTADSALQNVVEDTTPQLGGNLDLNSNDITGTGDIDITGDATLTGNKSVKLPRDGDGFIARGIKFHDTLGGTEILADSSDNLTIKSVGNIVVNANDGEIKIKDGGSAFAGQIDLADDNNVTVSALIANKDIIFKGNDHDGISGVTVTALTLDMSDAGKALFNAGATFGSGIDVTGTVTADGLNVDAGSFVINTSGASLITSTGSVKIDIDSDNNATDNRFLITSDGNTNNRLQIRENGDFSLFEDTGTTAKLFWDASAESLGIGTSSPARPLSVHSTSINPNIKLTRDGTSESLELGSFYITSNSNDLQLATSGSNDITLLTNNTERMRIDSSGNVGIGATNPAGWRLRIEKADAQHLLLFNTTGNGTRINMADQSWQGEIEQSAGSLLFKTGGTTERMRINANGNVGIGTTDPSTRLSVRAGSANGIELDQDSDLATDSARLFFNSSSGGYSIFNTSGSLRFNSGATAGSSSGTERMRIDSSGNVGIGTDSPSTYDSRANNLVVGDSGDAGITIFSGASNDARLQFAPSGDTGLNNGLIGYDNANDKMSFATAGSDRMHIDSSGNVGIGTNSPAYTLHTKSSSGGVALIESTASNSDLYLKDSGTTYNYSNGIGSVGDALRFRSGDGTERMRIDSSGNLLVGTTSTSTATQGIKLRSDLDAIAAVADGQISGYFGRLNSDGDILNFRKDGTTVGSIGTVSTYLTIGKNDTGLLFMDASDYIEPFNLSTNAARDAAIDLGRSGARFKDLYLSGTAKLNFINHNETIYPTSDAAVDIGTSSERYRNLYLSGLVRLGTSTTYGTIEGKASSDLEIIANAGQINGNPNIIFKSSNAGGAVTERARIDASGHLLIGKTDTTFNTAGIALRQEDVLQVTRSGDTALELNRTSNDGKLAEFYKDGTSVGSIGTNSGLFIGSTYGNDAGIRFASDIIAPSTTTGANRDAAIDLGYSSSRFKNLYLSGGVYANNASGAFLWNAENSHIAFGTNNTERARFNSAGNLLVGLTSSDYLAADDGIQLNANGTARFGGSGTSARNLLSFVNGTDGTPAEVGFIQTNGSATSYSTSSDQRLKDNIVDAPSASDDIDAIQVRSFDWKADGSHQKYGMVAQELQSVAPEAVTGDADSDDMMGVDYSKLVPMLVKEIQSLRARVAQLEGAN